MTDSVTFNSDGTVFSQDGQVLNRGVQNPSAMSDSQKATIGIQTRTSDYASFNTGTDAAATHQSSTLRVQLQAPTGLVKVPGTNHEVTPEVLEVMRTTSPELFVEPSVKAAEVAKESDNAKDIDAKREEINRFVDPAAEGVAMHISHDVEFGDQVRLLHELHTTGTVSTGTLNRVADQMHMSVDETVAALNAVSMNTAKSLAITTP
jgi:hypothetical protein